MVTDRLPVVVLPVMGLAPIDQPVGLLVWAGVSSVIDVSDRPRRSSIVKKLIAVVVARMTFASAPGTLPFQLLGELQLVFPPWPFQVDWARASRSVSDNPTIARVTKSVKTRWATRGIARFLSQE